ncbi:MAG: small basic protein [Planctomycetota bacterium]|nr:MAG: small basic protein [Planctomycetota bacterium]RLS93478.1 MAG: small basic protein [Planctomycetota bacterium]
MSIHSSLKTKSGNLASHRGVFTREERISKLTEAEKFGAGKSPLGLPKVLSVKLGGAKKEKAAVDGAAAPAAAGGKKAAAKPAAKPAAKK